MSYGNIDKYLDFVWKIVFSFFCKEGRGIYKFTVVDKEGIRFFELEDFFLFLIVIKIEKFRIFYDCKDYLFLIE